MPIVTEYAHGTPSWVDLATPDPAAARAFYGELFGWDYEEGETDQPGVHYIMANKGGQAAAGMMQLSPEMAAGGMPPCWTTYINVDDLEAAVDRVGPAGGTVMQPPMDVMAAGRMAVVADSTGAVVCLWEKRLHIGAGVVDEPGSLTWNELVTPDPGKAAAFYAEVLGWTSEAMPMGDFDYTVFDLPGGDGQGIAGAMPPPMEGMPAFWGVYFAVADCEASVATATGLGATVLAPPMDVPPGRMATLLDPQGAAFSVIALAQPPAG